MQCMQPGLSRSLKISLGNSPDDTGYNVLVEVGVSLKTNLHRGTQCSEVKMNFL